LTTVCILTIPGISISVERLFSSSKHTLSNTRSSMTVESALKTITTKEWLKKGFGYEVHYLDNVRILLDMK
jgi:hAT family C-terminal dimerisation region